MLSKEYSERAYLKPKLYTLKKDKNLENIIKYIKKQYNDSVEYLDRQKF